MFRWIPGAAVVLAAWIAMGCGSTINLRTGQPRLLAPVQDTDTFQTSLNYWECSAGDCGTNRPLLSAHPGGANTLRADGSAGWLSQDVDLELLYNLANRGDRRSTHGDE